MKEKIIKSNEHKKPEKIEFEVNLKDYPKDAIYAAAYQFLDEVYISLKDVAQKKAIKREEQIVTIIFEKKAQNKNDLETIKKEFLNELLYSAIRNNLSKKNKKIREAIVAQALFSAVGGFGEASGCDDDKKKDEISVEKDKDSSEKEVQTGIENDPLGISMAWEDKYSKK